MEFVFSRRTEGVTPSAIREMFKTLKDTSIISFAAGNPNPLSFPAKDLSRIAERLFESPSCLQYGITEGYDPLKETIKKRCREKYGIGSDGDDVMIVTGGQQGIDLCARTLVNEGDTVLCEEPSFIGALNSFRSYGARTVGIPMGDGGIDTDAFEKLLKTEKNVKLVYLIPTFQNPTGMTMTCEKRRAVVSLSERYGVPVLEDDPYLELRFRGESVPTIKSMDKSGGVIYCSSFSKLLSPGMRVGYLVADKKLIARAAVAKQSADVHTNLFFQMLCDRYINEYDFDGHIRDIRDLYGKKCAVMLDSLDRYCGGMFTHTEPDGGLFVWCTLPEGYDGRRFADVCIENKVAVVPGTTFSNEPEKKNRGFRLNFSMPEDEDIVRGVKALAAAFEQMTKH